MGLAIDAKLSGWRDVCYFTFSLCIYTSWI